MLGMCNVNWVVFCSRSWTHFYRNLLHISFYYCISLHLQNLILALYSNELQKFIYRLHISIACSEIKLVAERTSVDFEKVQMTYVTMGASKVKLWDLNHELYAWQTRQWLIELLTCSKIARITGQGNGLREYLYQKEFTECFMIMICE